MKSDGAITKNDLSPSVSMSLHDMAQEADHIISSKKISVGTLNS